MKNKKLFNLSAIILGVMTLFSFNSVQATESVFSDTIPTRSNAQAYTTTTFSSSQIVPITLGISQSEYKTNNENVYWTIKDSDGKYKDIYCLNLERGFGAPNGDITNSNNTKVYNNQYDLNSITNTQYETLTGLTTANKNKILWILNNSLTSSDSLSVILNAASQKVDITSIGLTSTDTEKLIKEDMQSNTRESTKLTFDDIKMVQQIAVWHYTNQGSIFDNTISAICNSEGKQISSLMEENIDIYGYGVGPYIRNGLVKQAKLNALYQYFIDGAESGSSESVVPSLALSNTNAKISESGDSYIVGPFSLTGENTELIKEVTATANIDYTLLKTAASTQGITNNDFSEVINSTFYLKIAKDNITQNTEIRLKLTYKYDVRELTFLTNAENEEYKTTQPVVLVKSEEKTENINTTAEIKLTQVVVEKVWDDNNNQDGKRPESIVVNLLADGNKIDSKTVTADSQGKWECTFTNLLENKDGKEVEYTVTENTINNYTTAITGDITNGFIITNTHVPETIDISGTKTWVDNNNQDGKRPESIVVNLLANGTEIQEVTATADNDWKYSFTNLPKYEAGEEIEYTITEDAVADYTTTINGYDITNTHIPETIDISGTKTWVDNNNQDGKRPESIVVNLLANGTEIQDVTVTADADWKYSFTNLPKYEAGEEITYTITEDAVTDYTTTIDGYDITNKYTPGKVSKTVVKVWEDNDNQDGIRPENITVKLYKLENNEQVDLDTQELNESNNWTYTWIELDEKSNGEKIIYGIEEITSIDGYTTEYSAENYKDVNTITITNTHEIEITDEYSVKLLKVSEDGTTPISGAWFKIDDGQPILVSETGKEIATGILAEAGELNLTYKLEETTAPVGYIKIDGQKEVKINAKVELKDDEYQITEVKLVENLDGITVNEENNVITIKVENQIEVTGKYNVVLRKVDENGNILTGSKFEVDGKEYNLSTGEVTILEDTELTSTKDIELTYPIKEIQAPEGYETIEDTTIYVRAKIQKQDNNYKLIRVELVNSEGNVITDENISVKVEGDSIVITVVNNPIPKKFDLSLRKFITKVNDIEYSREPIVDTSKLGTVVDGKVITTATYKHTKEPIAVQKGDVVTYTIRVYNEGEVDGYVEMITDHLPDNLLPIIDGLEGIDSEKYKEEIEFNSNWLWLYYGEGNTVTTTITSKSNSDSDTYSVLTGLEEVTDTKLNAYVEGSDKLDYIDVQIKCLVTENAVSGEYLTNIAEISKMCDADGVEVQTDRDSTKANADISNLADYKNNEAINSTEESYVEGQEDDDDFEKLVVKEFDLSLRKFITKVNETSYSRMPVVDTSKLGTIVDGKVITTATYNHSKEPVIVETADLVTYTIRIYNEGTLAGFANEITDDIPEGLEFLPDSSVNISYRWRMLDQDGNETEDTSKAVMIVTDYLSDIDKNNVINPVSEVDGVKTLSYKDVEVQFKVVAKAENLKDNIIINEAQISADSDRDIDSVPNRDEKYDYTAGNNEDDIDYEPIKLQYFDLALRKFITKVNLVDYNNRYPEIKYNEDGSITYNHTKDPVLVTTNDIVVYTIRVYNEGEKAGFVTEIIDNLPDGLEFISDNETNKQYGWKLLDSEGNVTEELDKAVKASTDYLKDEIIAPLIEENGQKILSYKDVQIAFKVVEPNTSDRILVNTAEISEDSDDDIDSVPGNDVLTEDDIDREYVKVQYFDLSLKKWVTKTEVTYNGKTTTTKTGFTEDTDEIAKVDLVASKMKKTIVKFAYNIKVTNEGELPGYAYEVKDYIPSGLKFVAEDNKDWKELEDGTVVTDKLKDTLLNPGESATVEIILTWKNSTTNTGLKTNYAEISQDSADDIDSTPDNYNLKEDDIDDAQVILSIKTAGAPTYIGLVFLSVGILAGGIFLIKKYVI